MSLHVGSRWYRAPEISLIEKQYDFATDMWSFGCIIHELIQYFIALNFTHKESFKKDFQKLRYIYQSNSCFPLSPYEENKKDKQKDIGSKSDTPHLISKDDQNLIVIKDLGP